MAVSASRGRFWIQFLFLECVLYFTPFWSRVILLLESSWPVLVLNFHLEFVCSVFASQRPCD